MKKAKKSSRDTRHAERMKAWADIQPEDEMRASYDFRGGVRGKYVERLAAIRQKLTVVLDPDVAAAFPTQAKVNAALRGLMRRKRAK
jgi:hypothetical protein